MKMKGSVIAVFALVVLSAWWGSEQPQPLSALSPAATTEISYSAALNKVRYGLDPWLYQHMQGNLADITGTTQNQPPKVTMEQIVWELSRNQNDMLAQASEIDVEYIVRTRDHKPLWLVSCLDVNVPLHMPAHVGQRPLNVPVPRREAVTYFVNADTGKSEGTMIVTAP